MDVIYSIILGVVASLIAWWAVNMLLIPKFDISEILFNNDSRPYIMVWNKSWHCLNAYDVKCYVSYYYENQKKAFFIRENPTKPYLKKGKQNENSFVVKMGGDECLKNFFHKNGNKLEITITGQNKFGVRQVFCKCLIVSNTDVDI